jgi:hypothetical protein
MPRVAATSPRDVAAMSPSTLVSRISDADLGAACCEPHPLTAAAAMTAIATNLIEHLM